MATKRRVKIAVPLPRKKILVSRRVFKDGGTWSYALLVRKDGEPIHLKTGDAFETEWTARRSMERYEEDMREAFS